MLLWTILPPKLTPTQPHRRPPMDRTNLLKPELLAPAGDAECARAAIENGADAIYFGLQVGHNARGRATNFALNELPQLMALLHRRGVRGYVTLNTLAFTDELPGLEQHLRAIVGAGVDAVLVQDLGVARLARVVCPDLPLHASTQATMTSAETIAAVAELGFERVVLARELSLRDIGRITSASPVPVEVFVHGALCVAYSGQCLTSESLGGRSANRGECAQACRLPYELRSDGQRMELGDVRYLLSPQDLAAHDLIPGLIAAGVASLKIEGRLKTPEYVANTVARYREGIDSAVRGTPRTLTAEAWRELELSFSRGFSPGWLEGCDHKRLTPGLSSSKRGVCVGEVIRRRGARLDVLLSHPLKRGDGVVLEGDRSTGAEIGGRIYQLFQNGREVEGPVVGRVELAMQHGLLDRASEGGTDGAGVWPGQKIWQTADPALSRRLRDTYSGKAPRRLVGLSLNVRVRVGEPIALTAQTQDGVRVAVDNDFVPQPAHKHPTEEPLLREQFGRLGGSPYRLDDLEADIAGSPMVPLSVLGALRKELLARLDAVREAPPQRQRAEPGAAERLLQSAREQQPFAQQLKIATGIELRVLCRSLSQIGAALEAGAKHLIADLHDPRDFRAAVERCRAGGSEVLLATLRIHKPGETGLLKAMARHSADGWLVRNLAALDFAREHKIPAVADFSLNATNPLSAQWLLSRGAAWVTPSFDLNRDQLHELVAAAPADWFEVVLHQHMPMFHMEHCVFCSVLSPGKNKSDCGRPCDRHAVELVDRAGIRHVLHADIGCRNTLYNGQAQSGAEAAPGLLARGVKRFRIELLNDAPSQETARLIGLYGDLLAGRCEGAAVWRALRAENRIGVTRGPMEAPRNPLAVL